MDIKEHQILGESVGSHWYYRAKAGAVEAFLQNVRFTEILDVGAGSGFFSRQLLTQTNCHSACCVDIGYEDDKDEIYCGKPLHFRRSVDNSTADLVLMMDVLEHVDDDVALLKDYVAKVSVGTKFLISVPAFQFLWSGHDVFLEHRRRYTLLQMEHVIQQAGLKNVKGSYYFGLVFPLAAATRLAQRFQPKQTATSQLTVHSPIVNHTLAALCTLEKPFLKFNRLAGLTVFCLAEK